MAGQLFQLTIDDNTSTRGASPEIRNNHGAANGQRRRQLRQAKHKANEGMHHATSCDSPAPTATTAPTATSEDAPLCSVAGVNAEFDRLLSTGRSREDCFRSMVRRVHPDKRLDAAAPHPDLFAELSRLRTATRGPPPRALLLTCDDDTKRSFRRSMAPSLVPRRSSRVQAAADAFALRVKSREPPGDMNK